MPPTYHSEYLDIKSICIKTAESAFVSEAVLNQQWKTLNYLEKPNYKLALEEYHAFEEIIKISAPAIYHFPFDPSLTIDSIYCRDASIATDFGVIICNMGKSGRVNEPISQQIFFEKNNIPILGQIKSPGTLEGGDVAWIDEKTLAVGSFLSHQ